MAFPVKFAIGVEDWRNVRIVGVVADRKVR